MLDAEIVIADSVQVYRHLDIGSNKPSAQELSDTPHHLVNLREPCEQFSAGEFVAHAGPVIRDILGRGKVPIVVGGSTMWIQWLVHGTPDAPKPCPEDSLRAAEILAPFEERGQWAEARAVASQYGAERMAKLPANDWYRLRRYLEVCLSLSRKSAGAVLTGQRQQLLPDVDLRCFFLSETRANLYRHVDSRCEAMIEAGLLQEVAQLVLSKRLTPDDAVSKAIGYRQTIEYLCRREPRRGDVAAFETFVKDFATGTRNYAKRQLSWYRRDDRFLWLQIERSDPLYKKAAAEEESSYVRVAEELLHWCSLSRDQHAMEISNQIARGKTVTNFKNRSANRLNFPLDSDLCYESIADMLASDEISAEDVKRHRQFDPSRLVTLQAEQSQQRRSDFSATDSLLRSSEVRPKALVTYSNRFGGAAYDARGVITKENIALFVEQADRCVDGLQSNENAVAFRNSWEGAVSKGGFADEE